MDKIYVWNGKTRSSQYGEFYTIWVKLEELEKYVWDSGYVNLVINKRKEPDNYGNDLTVTINDYKPENKEIKVTPMKWDNDISIEDIPF